MRKLSSSLLVSTMIVPLAISTIASASMPAPEYHHGATRGASKGEYGQSNPVPYKLDAQLHKHAALATPALQAELLDEPSKTGIMAALDNNSEAIADSVEKIYPGTREQFLELWRAHITYYLQYLTAAENESEGGKEQAKQNLSQFVDDVTQLLSKENDEIDASNLAQQLNIHGEQTLAIIDELVARDFTSAYRLSGEAYAHMTKVTEAMVPKFN